MPQLFRERFDAAPSENGVQCAWRVMVQSFSLYVYMVTTRNHDPAGLRSSAGRHRALW